MAPCGADRQGPRQRKDAHTGAHRTGRPCRPPPRPGRPPPPAPAAGISHFKDGRWGSRQALARGHGVSPAATAPAVVRALGDVPSCGRTAAGGSSATRGSRRSTGTLEGFFSAHGAALLCDGCSGAQLWATAFLGERRNRSPEQPHQVLSRGHAGGTERPRPRRRRLLTARRLGRSPCASPQAYLPSLHPPHSFARFVIDRLFSTVELGSSSYSLATSPRADRRGPQIFLFHCVAFLLTFLTGSFAECYFFILTRSNLSVFFLYELWFWNRVQGLLD